MIMRYPDKVHILGGGTVFHVRPHFSLTATAYGATAKELHRLFLSHEQYAFTYATYLTLSKMADPENSTIETNDDAEAFIDTLLEDPKTKVIINNMALSDYQGFVLDEAGNATQSGKEQPRMQSRNGEFLCKLIPAKKVIEKVKQVRPDIILVGFKTTAGDTEDVQIEKSKRQIKECGSDYVFANDMHTRMNVLVRAETETRALSSFISANRQTLLESLVENVIEDLFEQRRQAGK